MGAATPGFPGLQSCLRSSSAPLPVLVQAFPRGRGPPICPELLLWPLLPPSPGCTWALSWQAGGDRAPGGPAPLFRPSRQSLQSPCPLSVQEAACSSLVGKPLAPIPHGCSLAWLHRELTGGCTLWVSQAEAVATLSSSGRAGSEKEVSRLAGRSRTRLNCVALSPPSGSGPGPCLGSLWWQPGAGHRAPRQHVPAFVGCHLPRAGLGACWLMTRSNLPGPGFVPRPAHLLLPPF